MKRGEKKKTDGWRKDWASPHINEERRKQLLDAGSER